MKKTSEYRQHAEECRALAKQMKEGDQRDQMLKIAATWEKLAEEQEAWRDIAQTASWMTPLQPPSGVRVTRS